jgi:hypothetical protein
LPVSDKKLSEICAQEPFDARQTYSTQKRKRKGPDIGNEDRSPDFSMVLDLDRNFTSPEGELEHEKKSALSGFGQIGVSSRDQWSRSFAACPENRSASQNVANNSTNSKNGETAAMQEPTRDFDLLGKGGPFWQRVETERVICQ